MKKELITVLESSTIEAVIDAIRVLSESDTAEEIWQTLKNANPEILSHCKRFHFSKNKLV